MTELSERWKNGEDLKTILNDIEGEVRKLKRDLAELREVVEVLVLHSKVEWWG